VPKILVLVVVFAEIKQVEEVADRRIVPRNIGIVVIGLRVRQVVSAAIGQRLQVPVALDELQNRDVVDVGVADVPAAREVRDDDQRNARPVTEKIDRLDIAGVVVAAAFIERPSPPAYVPPIPYPR
jgi:hypothetical protein